MRERRPEEPDQPAAREGKQRLPSELAAQRELNQRRGELLAMALSEARPALATLHRLGDLLALPDCPPERSVAIAAQLQRAAMQLENLLTDLAHAAHLPRLGPRLDLEVDRADDPAYLRELLSAGQQRSAELESQVTAAREAQHQLQSYADDFRRIDAESRQRLQQMAALYEVSTSIGATVDPQEVLARTTEGLERLLPGSSLAIYLLEEQSQLARREVVLGVLGEDLAPPTLKLGEGLLGRSLASGRILSEGIEELGAGLWKLALPLSIGPSVLGALLVARRQAEPFAEEERRLAEMVATQAALALQNARLATTDALTGLYNRRYFEQALAFECDRARRTRRPLGLLMADVDYFKRFNEHHGHPAGDEVLRQVAGTLAGHLRRTDIVARIGGEEFAAILPEDDLEAVAVAAERLRQAVEQRAPLLFEGLELPPVRISVGGASLSGEAVTPPVLIRAADDALRGAKRGGRNRSLVVGPEPGDAALAPKARPRRSEQARP